MVDKPKNVKTSNENLVHFQCPYCKGWWSIGDAPKREHWFCPWCGEKSQVSERDREYTYNEIMEKYFPNAGSDREAIEFDWKQIGDDFKQVGRDLKRVLGRKAKRAKNG